MSNVLVTGGARGIGRGIVEALAGEGHNIGFCGRASAENITDFLHELQTKFSGKFVYYQSDVSQISSHSELLKKFIADFGTLDVLINNAGVAPEVRADFSGSCITAVIN